MTETNTRGDLRENPDTLAIQTRGVRTTYEREIITEAETIPQIMETSIPLSSPPAESLVEWTEEGRGKVRARPDPIALKTRGLKTTYEVRYKGGFMVELDNNPQTIEIENNEGEGQIR